LPPLYWADAGAPIEAASTARVSRWRPRRMARGNGRVLAKSRVGTTMDARSLLGGHRSANRCALAGVGTANRSGQGTALLIQLSLRIRRRRAARDLALAGVGAAERRSQGAALFVDLLLRIRSDRATRGRALTRVRTPHRRAERTALLVDLLLRIGTPGCTGHRTLPIGTALRLRRRTALRIQRPALLIARAGPAHDSALPIGTPQWPIDRAPGCDGLAGRHLEPAGCRMRRGNRDRRGACRKNRTQAGANASQVPHRQASLVMFRPSSLTAPAATHGSLQDARFVRHRGRGASLPRHVRRRAGTRP
jgi:hypothetical protein